MVKGSKDSSGMPIEAQSGVHTLSRGILCPGCQQPFTPRRPNHRHCRPGCRKLAERNREAARLQALLERVKRLDQAAEEWAQRFHEAHERLAPAFGYPTAIAAATPWAQVPDLNKRLLIAVCAELIEVSILPISRAADMKRAT